MINLKKAEAADRKLLWNIHQKYLYEMTKYYPDEMDENGNYHYGYFDAYFIEPSREAYFIFESQKIVGFTMINFHSYLGHEPDHVIAEFTIFPSDRKKGFATEAVRIIFDRFRGRWEIKFHEKNTGAKKLWETITKDFHPTIHYLNEDETVLEFIIHES